jgi:outer membrane protein TolC
MNLFIPLLLVATIALPQQRLSLAEAIEIGLRPGNRADLALAIEAIAKSKSQARAAKAALLPTVEANVSVGERLQNLATQGFGGAVPGGGGLPFALNPSFTTFDARPVVSATLLNLSQWRTWKATQQESDKLRLDREATMESAASAIARLYITCLDAAAQIQSRTAAVALSQDLLAAAEQRLRAGTVTVVDVSRARSQLAKDRTALVSQRQAELEAKAALFRAIGLESIDDIDLTNVPDLALPIPDSPSLDLNSALANRTDWKSKEAAVQVASMKLKAAQWEKLPTISGSFDAGRNGTSPWNTAWTRSGSVSFKMTLLDFGRRAERETQAAIALREEQIRLADYRREIARQIRVSRGKLDSARAQSSSAQAELELTTLQLLQVREREAAGLATGLDVADAQNRNVQSRLSLDQAIFSLRSAELDYLEATGQVRQLLEKP